MCETRFPAGVGGGDMRHRGEIVYFVLKGGVGLKKGRSTGEQKRRSAAHPGQDEKGTARGGYESERGGGPRILQKGRTRKANEDQGGNKRGV